MSLTDQIPGLREAVEKEQFIRDTAFLDIPEQICGIDVKPLTLRHVLALSLVGSPFMVGGNPSPVDCAQFLWCVSTRWNPDSKWQRRLFMIRCGKINAVDCVNQIDEFLRESFQDAPPRMGGGDRPSYYSYAAFMVDTFAHQYGWTDSQTLDMPCKRAFQLLCAIRKRNNPEATLFNPSDSVRGKWLDEINRERN